MSDSALTPRQKFTVSHLNEADFKTGGLRDYSAYRDLGIAAATSGLATAHVIRMIAPFDEKFSQRHHHNVEFQLVYVLKGWFKTILMGMAPSSSRRGRAGYSHLGFLTLWLAGRMIVSYSKSFFRRSTKPSTTTR